MFNEYLGTNSNYIESVKNEAFRKGVEVLKDACIVHIQKNKPLTREEIIHIIQFEAERLMK